MWIMLLTAKVWSLPGPLHKPTDLVCLHMHVFVLKSTLASKNHLKTYSVLLEKMSGFVELDQMQMKGRWADGAEMIAVAKEERQPKWTVN